MRVAQVVGTEGTEPPWGAFDKHMAATASRPFQGHLSPPVRYGRAEAADAEWARQEHALFLSKVAAALSRYVRSLAKHWACLRLRSTKATLSGDACSKEEGSTNAITSLNTLLQGRSWQQDPSQIGAESPGFLSTAFTFLVVPFLALCTSKRVTVPLEAAQDTFCPGLKRCLSNQGTEWALRA